MSEVQLNSEKEPIHSTDITEDETSKFMRRIIANNAVACHDIRSEGFDMDNAKQISHEGLTALGARDGLQSMLVAQMLSVHQLQQRAMVFANGLEDGESKQYYTNTTIKLANCFVQQANMLAKLQGVGGQKIIVERVDVHQGGQAVVGTINTSNRD